MWTHPGGAGLKELTTPANGSLSESPVWSPDGKRLLFQRLFFHGFTLTHIDLDPVNVDGTGSATVAELPNVMFYSWGTAPVG
ncbi:MAG: hypothetical protein ABI828_07850 [Actinomycetota bacterium]